MISQCFTGSAALLIIQNGLWCGFAQFKLGAHFLDDRSKRIDRRLTEGQLLRRASVKRKACGSPTKNGCANLAPLRLCWYFTDNDSGLVTSYLSSSISDHGISLPRIASYSGGSNFPMPATGDSVSSPKIGRPTS